MTGPSSNLAVGSSEASGGSSDASGGSFEASVASYEPSNEMSEKEITDEEEEDIKNFGKFPVHIEFIKMLRSSQKMADHINKKVPLQWRGYKSSVFPNLPPFSVEDMRNRLLNALKGVSNITVPERQVRLKSILG